MLAMAEQRWKVEGRWWQEKDGGTGCSNRLEVTGCSNQGLEEKETKKEHGCWWPRLLTSAPSLPRLQIAQRTPYAYENMKNTRFKRV